jgi:hypothetical protein
MYVFSTPHCFTKARSQRHHRADRDDGDKCGTLRHGRRRRSRFSAASPSPASSRA